MEDISRELEREIAKSKPKPFRKNRKIKILIVDDFGKVISGNYIKIILLVLSFISIITFLISTWLFYHYSVLSQETGSTKKRLLLAEKKINELTDEKEVLMARLVILGKDPGINKIVEKSERPLNNDLEGKKMISTKLQDIKSTALDTPDILDEEKQSISQGIEKEKTTGDHPGTGLTSPGETETRNIAETNTVKKTISIEKFSVIRNKTGKDLLVRFDIRNVSKDQGDVSGRIFTILRPDNDIEDQWLIIPAVRLKNGVPGESQKGQYFSISHFKPVKFRIKSEVDPDFYKKASIFIFNSEGMLIFEKSIEIKDAE